MAIVSGIAKMGYRNSLFLVLWEVPQYHRREKRGHVNVEGKRLGWVFNRSRATCRLFGRFLNLLAVTAYEAKP
jgi:hypothetical protein